MDIQQTYRLFYKLRGFILACIVLCVICVPISIIFVKTPDVRIILPISFAAAIPALISMYKKGKSAGKK